MRVVRVLIWGPTRRSGPTAPREPAWCSSNQPLTLDERVYLCRILPRARPASRRGSRSPRSRFERVATDIESILDTTADTLISASSSSFSMRCHQRARSRVRSTRTGCSHAAAGSGPEARTRLQQTLLLAWRTTPHEFVSPGPGRAPRRGRSPSWPMTCSARGSSGSRSSPRRTTGGSGSTCWRPPGSRCSWSTRAT